MNKFVLATCKLNNSFVFAEEKIIELFIQNNNDFIFEKIYTQLNNTSKLFKEYPILYYNGRIFETKKILKFFFELLFGYINFEHFEYLLIFLYNEFRYLYKDNLLGLTSKYILINEKRNIDIIKILNDYIEFYKDKKEKVFIYNIIFYFIEEYLVFQKGKENENLIELKRLLKLNTEEIKNTYKISNETLIEEISDKYCIKNPLNKDEIFIDPDEIASKNNWKNNIFSLGLFLGFTSIFYLISLKK